MELVLKNLGTIKITAAMQTAGGDIRIEYEDEQHIIVRNTFYSVTESYITNIDSEWLLVVFLDTRGDTMCNDTAVFEIENQKSVYKLYARL